MGGPSTVEYHHLSFLLCFFGDKASNRCCVPYVCPYLPLEQKEHYLIDRVHRKALTTDTEILTHVRGLTSVGCHITSE